MATIYVKKDGSGDALTIQQGIQLAQSGDTVEVEPGTFDENIDLWKGINLKGAGSSQTIVTGLIRANITARAFVFVTGQTTLNLTQTMIDSGVTTSDYEVGRIVTASGIPTNTRIVSKTSTSITLSSAVTSAAASRTIAMALQNDATIRVRGTNGSIRGIKFVGFDSTNPATEYSSVYFRNAALGSVAANGWEVYENEFVAAGEYAILTDYTPSVGNLNFHNNVVSGKTFVGENPATGNQFSVWNVPRQLVTIQSVNTNVIFQNNQITGVTGGLTVDGTPSYNTAITIDPIGSIISGNTIDVTSGYGYCLRARGLNSQVSNNSSAGVSAGYYILPNHALSVAVAVGTIVLNSSKYWICIQDHTSDATNAPTGANGASYWSEVTLEQVNSSSSFGLGDYLIGSNSASNEVLITFSQSQSGDPVEISFSKNLIKSIPSISADPVFSDESNWKLVGLVYKKDSKRMTSGFKSDFNGTNQMRLKLGLPGELFALHKVIISKADRTLKVVQRSEISNAGSFDITLK